MENNKFVFTKKMKDMGGSHHLIFPKELVEWAGIKEEDEVHIIGDIGKHGRFIAIWAKKKEE